MKAPYISFTEGEVGLSWLELVEALRQGHSLPRAEIGDTFLYRNPDTLLSRAAWVSGLGMAVKTATVFPRNPDNDRPMINGAVCLYSDQDGTLSALIDFHLVTKWKTAGDSLLAAIHLARADSRFILVVGAGTVARSVCQAFQAGFPDARIVLWNRTRAKAESLAREIPGAIVGENLEASVRGVDIVVCATMSSEPVIRGEWLQEGQHINLIGAYRADMREADDTAIRRSRVFVDSFETTIGHIGELAIPMSRGVVSKSDLIADFYDLAAFSRRDDSDITLFKNGGGAHLDLMTSCYILDQWQARQ